MTAWIMGFIFLMIIAVHLAVHQAVLGHNKEGNPPLTHYHLAAFFLGLANGLFLAVCALFIIKDG